MNHALTLEAVQKDFQQWRLSRKKRASIPDDLEFSDGEAESHTSNETVNIMCLKKLKISK